MTEGLPMDEAPPVDQATPVDEALPVDEAPPVDEALLSEAVDLIREAGRLSLHWFGRTGLQVDRKGDGTPVTEADREIERYLRQEIGRRHPADGIVGEEEPPRPSRGGRTWVIDPIDGTEAFTRGVPLYANLLAIDDEHGPAIGVVNVPAIGQLVWAARGLGCWHNGEPARVSTQGSVAGSYLTTSGFESWPEQALLAVKEAGAALRTWGDGYGYLLVATGQVDAMVDARAERYDVAAMAVLLAEAGGRFSSIDGRATTKGGNGVATNGRIHQELLGLLAAR